MADAATRAASGSSADRDEPRLRSRIAVLFERGRHGAAALEEASELAARSGSELTVVVLAPQAPAARCCGPSPAAYNCAVLDDATAELREAANALATPGEQPRFTLLIEGTDPPLKTWVALEGFDCVMLPARRRVLRSRGHPAVRKLRRVAGCNVRVIADHQRQAPSAAPTQRTA